MNANPFARKLGFDSKDRLAIIHADDIGMCQATLSALDDLADFGLVKSCSVMVPCPWFPAAADWCRNHPDVDAGVHLTLTSEWDGYRWGPLSTRDQASGLVDEEGYFHRDVDSLWSRADPSAALVEMRAQIERARAMGLDPTHLDCHMHAAADERFIHHYAEMALDLKLPALIVRNWPRWREETKLRVGEWEERGLPIFDHLKVLNLSASLDDPARGAREAFDELPPGLSCVLIHPASDTPELRAIVPNWRARVADYEAFLSEELFDHIRDSGIHLIDYRSAISLQPSAFRLKTDS
ncbi:MAG: polysaccharide deacetylase family protein [Blastocatellia bacterium]|nr:polysaccharide deacetylase family protein [Blastocatellia bacterium]